MEIVQIKRDALIQEIKKMLIPIKPHRVILFGSFVFGRISEDSDLDLIVVLNEAERPLSYRQVLKQRMFINQILRQIRSRIPIDLLVYTIGQWEQLRQNNSSFYREISEKGLRIL